MIKHIAFILVDNYSLMSLASSIEPLRAANHLSEQTLYEITIIRAQEENSKSSSGAFFDSISISEASFDYDLILVAAAATPASYDNKALFQYLSLAAAKKIKLGGISGGPVLLARAGVMKNKRFTVHWDHFEMIKELDPELLAEKSIYLIDGDRFTCAGGIAPMDMISAIISQDHGRGLAKDVNDWFIYTSLRNSTEPQRAGLVEKYQVHHPAVVTAIELMQNHISDPLSSAQIAELSAIGERQLSRMFQKYLGKKPTQFYKEIRMEHARVLTLQTALPIIEIALASGYDSASYFSQQFKACFGKTPSKMRKDSI